MFGSHGLGSRGQLLSIEYWVTHPPCLTSLSTPWPVSLVWYYMFGSQGLGSRGQLLSIEYWVTHPPCLTSPPAPWPLSLVWYYKLSIRSNWRETFFSKDVTESQINPHVFSLTHITCNEQWYLGLSFQRKGRETMSKWLANMWTAPFSLNEAEMAFGSCFVSCSAPVAPLHIFRWLIFFQKIISR